MAKITLARIGKLLVGVGLFVFLQKDYTHCGCYSNTWGLIIGGVFFVGFGVILMLVDKLLKRYI